jgi:hypothetical protein
MSAEKSSRNSGPLKAAACLVLAAGLAGCVDYTKTRDTITLGAGEAQAWNRVVQTADPWPPYVLNTNIPGDGQRTERVIRGYSTGAGGAASPTEGGGGASGGAQ